MNASHVTIWLNPKSFLKSGLIPHRYLIFIDDLKSFESDPDITLCRVGSIQTFDFISKSPAVHSITNSSQVSILPQSKLVANRQVHTVIGN